MKEHTRAINQKITITGMIIALAVIVNLSRMDIPLASSPVLRISFGMPLLRFIAIAIGPLFGGIAAGITDILSYVFRPEGGPFLFPLTITSILDIMLTGFIWRWLKNVNSKSFSWVCVSVFGSCTFIGLYNNLVLNYSINAGYAAFLQNINDISIMSNAILIIGVIGLIAYFGTMLLWKNKNPKLFYRSVKLIVVIGIPTLIFSTANTFILQYFKIIPDNISIIFFLIPRWIRDMVMILFTTYIQLFLMEVYGKVGKFEKVKTNL